MIIAETIAQRQSAMLSRKAVLQIFQSPGEDGKELPFKCISEALRLANMGEFVEACRKMETQLKDIGSCECDEETRIRWLMVLGLVQCAAGAVEKSISTLQLALFRASNSNVSAKYAPMVMRRLAYVQLLDKCGGELEKFDCGIVERGMYYVIRYELSKREVLSNSSSRIEASSNEAGKPLAYLDRALRLFHGHYAQLEKNVYREGALYANKVGLEAVRNVCAKLFYEMTLPGHFNWFLL